MDVPTRICLRCSAPATFGPFCEVCRRIPEYRPPDRGKPTRKRKRPRGVDPYGRHSEAWYECRKRFLANNALCASCKHHKRLVAATEVDHVIPLKLRPEALTDEGNLQALCAKCHRRKSGWERRGIFYDFMRKRKIVADQ